MTIFLLAAVVVMAVAAILGVVFAVGAQQALAAEQQKVKRLTISLDGLRDDKERLGVSVAEMAAIVADRDERLATAVAEADRLFEEKNDAVEALRGVVEAVEEYVAAQEVRP